MAIVEWGTRLLTAKTASGDYIEAETAVRGSNYLCRGCGKPVIFKAGRVRTKHFAHYPDDACSYGAPMSAEHLKAQILMAQALRARGVGVELEAEMPSLAGDRRVDVLAWPKDRLTSRAAIEVQASDITVELIDQRTASYQAEEVAPLWLRLYDFGRWNEVQRLSGRNTIWIKKHMVRSWERWAHDNLGGHLWFMDSKTFLVWRGTFLQAHSYKEVSSWYGPGGEEEYAGGYWQDIKQWVELELEGPFQLADLRLKRGRVKGADNRHYLSAWFVPPGEDALPGRPKVRSRFCSNQYGHEWRELQIESENGWISASADLVLGDWRGLGSLMPND